MLYRSKVGCMAIGSGTGFLVGSYLYQETGIMGGCLFIGGFGLLHLVLTDFYIRRLLATQVMESKETSDEMTTDKSDAETVSVRVYKFFTPFLLSTGAVMVTTSFTVTPLYWEDVWSTKPVVCGLLLCIGEIVGFFILILSKSECLRNRKLMKQPAFIVMASLLGMMAMAPLAFSHLNIFKYSLRSFHADAVATVFVEVANGMLHSSGIELMVLFLPTHLFQSALTRGYVWKRFVNSGFGILFAFLYGICPYAPYQFVFGFFIVYISLMCILFRIY